MKKLLIISIVTIIIGYIFFSMIIFDKSSKNDICKSVEIIIKDSLEYKFIKEKEIRDILISKKINPEGKKIKDINTLAIKDSILGNSIIKTADVFLTDKENIIINITQRIPIVRVLTDNTSYYLDEDHKKIPVFVDYSIYLPIIRGNINDGLLNTNFWDFINFITKNQFWNSFINEIIIKNGNKIELIPKIGDFNIILGSNDNFEKKLDNLKIFLKKGLNIVGWNRYSTINLSYENQIVCVKK